MDDRQNVSPAEVFDQYFGPTLFTPWARVLLDHARPQPGDRVLDLACGTGTVARHAARSVLPGGQVVGVDLNPGMLSVARSRQDAVDLGVDWQEGDASALNFPDNSFDLVLCQQGFQFFQDRAAAAREARRVLKPGGRIWLNLWQSLEKHPLYLALVESEARHLNVPAEEVSGPFLFPDPDQQRALLESAGFRGVQITPSSLEVTFPSPRQFVELTLFAGVSFLDEFDPSDTAAFDRLAAAIDADIHAVVERYRVNDSLVFPVHWNIIRAEK